MIKYTIALFFLIIPFGCSKHDMDIEGIRQDASKLKKGIQIKIEPIEEKPQNLIA